mmetsp:Transcript_84171/g.180369  ORF Transcript_84171/g.180369 Transcript_84171/m.180369 type:complete len:341 (-) Transcript_84171:34-1056(-)
MMATPSDATLGLVDFIDQERFGFCCDKSSYAESRINHDLLLTSVGSLTQHGPTSELMQAEAALKATPTIQDVHALLGFGSFSYVFSSTVEGFSEGPVAVKVLKTLMPLQGREASILMTMDHPNIVKLLRIIESPCNALVLELCAGGCLGSFLHAEKYQHLAAVLTFRARLGAALDVAHALEYLHSKDTMHRDVKPDNCFLSASAAPVGECGPVKLGDMGFARECTGGHMTKEVGTWIYMAPEVVRDSDYDFHADTYSYGILLHDIISGVVPYSGSSLVNDPRLILRIARGLRPNLDEMALGCSTTPEIKSLTSDCWDQDAKKRPSFANIVDRLQWIFRAA